MIRRPACLLLTLVIALLGLVAPASAAPTVSRTITPGHSKPPSGGTTTTGLGLRPANNNAQLSENIPSRVRRSWATSPKSGICPYNGSEDLEFTARTTATNGRYTVALQSGRCDFVTGYLTKNGKAVWSAAFPRAWSLVSDGTYVYVHWEAVVDDSEQHFISALKISTGKVRWSIEVDDDPEELAVGSGVVVHGVAVYDAKTGRLRFAITKPWFNSFEPHTLVVKGMLIRNNRDVVDAWTPTGKPLWRYTKPTWPDGPGAGELMPQYNAGRVYVRDDSNTLPGTLVLDAGTGRKLATLPHSEQPLAIDGRVGIFTAGAAVKSGEKTTVSAIDLSDGRVYWTRSYAGDHSSGPLVRTPPVVENGLVWFGLNTLARDQPLRLVALDEVTGATRARIAETCRLPGHDPKPWDHEATGTIGVAQHRLFVPSSCGLQTYVAQR